MFKLMLIDRQMEIERFFFHIAGPSFYVDARKLTKMIENEIKLL